MEKSQVLREISFGERIAEDEIEQLRSYFVETDEWQRIFAGEIDIVYGSKGAGKSAIYSLLLERKQELSKRRIITLAAESPRGIPVFKSLINAWTLRFLNREFLKVKLLEHFSRPILTCRCSTIFH